MKDHPFHKGKVGPGGRDHEQVEGVGAVDDPKNVVIPLDQLQGADRETKDIKSPLYRDLNAYLQPNPEGACRGGHNEELHVGLIGVT